MSFINTLFKKRKQPLSSDNLEVSFDTDKNLSEEQKSAIIDIVKDGIDTKTNFHDIAIKIAITCPLACTGVSIYETKNGVEVIF